MTQESSCPVAAMARILAARWTLEIIHNLRERRRFCELQDRLGHISPTLLSQRLRFLEQEGLIRRIVHPEATRHVEYELTRKGQELLPILDQLAEWAYRWHLVEPTEQGKGESDDVPSAGPS